MTRGVVCLFVTTADQRSSDKRKPEDSASSADSNKRMKTDSSNGSGGGGGGGGGSDRSRNDHSHRDGRDRDGRDRDGRDSHREHGRDSGRDGHSRDSGRDHRDSNRDSHRSSSQSGGGGAYPPPPPYQPPPMMGGYPPFGGFPPFPGAGYAPPFPYGGGYPPMMYGGGGGGNPYGAPPGGYPPYPPNGPSPNGPPPPMSGGGGGGGGGGSRGGGGRSHATTNSAGQPQAAQQHHHHHTPQPSAAPAPIGPAAPPAPKPQPLVPADGKGLDEPLPPSRSDDPPSKVVHFRNIAAEIEQHEVVAVCQQFGAVEKVLMMRLKNQCLVMFAQMASAIHFMNYWVDTNTVPVVKGRKLFCRFSRHAQLTAAAHVSGSRILLATLSTSFRPEDYGISITADIVWQIFSPYGTVEKIVLMQKDSSLQALIQFQTQDQCATAHTALHNKLVYVATEPPVDITLHLQVSIFFSLSLSLCLVRLARGDFSVSFSHVSYCFFVLLRLVFSLERFDHSSSILQIT